MIYYWVRGNEVILQVAILMQCMSCGVGRKRLSLTATVVLGSFEAALVAVQRMSTMLDSYRAKFKFVRMQE